MERRLTPLDFDRRRVEFGLYIANDRRSGIVDRRTTKQQIEDALTDIERALENISKNNSGGKEGYIY